MKPRRPHNANSGGKTPKSLRAELDDGPAGSLIPCLIEAGISPHRDRARDGGPAVARRRGPPGAALSPRRRSDQAGTSSATLLHEACHVGRNLVFKRKAWPVLESRLIVRARRASRRGSSTAVASYKASAFVHLSGTDAPLGFLSPHIRARARGESAQWRQNQLPTAGS